MRSRPVMGSLRAKSLPDRGGINPTARLTRFSGARFGSGFDTPVY